MVRYEKKNGGTVSFYGVASDVKPLCGKLLDGNTAVVFYGGSSFVEIDTGNVYFYDETADKWRLFMGGGE